VWRTNFVRHDIRFQILKVVRGRVQPAFGMAQIWRFPRWEEQDRFGSRRASNWFGVDPPS
jgi:hypothetical protein